MSKLFGSCLNFLLIFRMWSKIIHQRKGESHEAEFKASGADIIDFIYYFRCLGGKLRVGGKLFSGKCLSGRFFHMLRASDYPLPEEFFTAYKNSRKIIFEIPPGETENPEHMGDFLSGAIYTDGTTLKDHITKAAYAKTENSVGSVIIRWSNTRFLNRLCF